MVLERQVQMLEAIRVERVVLVTGYLHSDVRLAVRGLSTPLDIEIVVEDEPRGTAEALRFAAQFVSSEKVVFMNGDTLIEKASWGTIADALVGTLVPAMTLFGNDSIPMDNADSYEVQDGLVVSRKRETRAEWISRAGNTKVSSGIVVMKYQKIPFGGQAPLTNGETIESVFIDPLIENGEVFFHPKNINFYDVGSELGFVNAENIFSQD